MTSWLLNTIIIDFSFHASVSQLIWHIDNVYVKKKYKKSKGRRYTKRSLK